MPKRNYRDNTKDFMFKTDSNYNPLVVSGPARYKQIITMLFTMIPGMDEYNPEKGLNIFAKLYNPTINMRHDTDYELEITNQFARYTDLNITNVTAMPIDQTFVVYFEVNTPEGTYQVILNNRANELTVLLTNQETMTLTDR